MLPPEITATCSVTSSASRSWTVETFTDPATGDIILPLPDEVLRSLGAELGDVLIWEPMGTDSWTLRRQSPTVLTRCRKYLTMLYNTFTRNQA